MDHHHHPHHHHPYHPHHEQHYPQQQSFSQQSSYEGDDTSMLNERLSNGQPINPNDVLSGRGKLSFNHGGNKRFRDAVTASLDQYMKAETRFEKSLVVHSIIDSIHQVGGRFLKKDFDSGLWFEMSRQQCKEKVGHAIRDAVNSYEARRKKKGKPNHTPSSLHHSVSSSQLATPAVRMSIASLSSHHSSTNSLKRRRDDPDSTTPPLTVKTDYSESVRKRRRSERPPSSIMRVAAPLKPSPITSTMQTTPDQQPMLTYSSETSGSYHQPTHQETHHFSFDIPPRQQQQQQRDDYPSSYPSRTTTTTASKHSSVAHDPEAPHADHFELAIEAVLGPMASGEEEDDEDGPSP